MAQTNLSSHRNNELPGEGLSRIKNAPIAFTHVTVCLFLSEGKPGCKGLQQLTLQVALRRRGQLA